MDSFQLRRLQIFLYDLQKVSMNGWNYCKENCHLSGRYEKDHGKQKVSIDIWSHHFIFHINNINYPKYKIYHI